VLKIIYLDPDIVIIIEDKNKHQLKVSKLFMDKAFAWTINIRE